MSVTYVGQMPTDIVRVSGNDRVDLLHRLSTNDLTPLSDAGTVRSTLFTTAQGRLIDWVTIVAEPETLLLLISAGRGARVASWIDTYTIMEDVRSEDVTSQLTHLVVHGPEAHALTAAVLGEPRVAATGKAVRVGTTWSWAGLAAYGARVELVVPAAKADEVVAALRTRGATVANTETFEALRVQAGVPGPATEYPDEVNPLELRLGPIAVSFRKGCYIGQEVISRLDSYDKVARLLVGFAVDAAGRAVLGDASDTELKLTREGRPFGRVTSLVATDDGGAVGLAVVKREGADVTTADLVSGDKTVPVRLERRPFF